MRQGSCTTPWNTKLRDLETFRDTTSRLMLQGRNGDCQYFEQGYKAFHDQNPMLVLCVFLMAQQVLRKSNMSQKLLLSFHILLSVVRSSAPIEMSSYLQEWYSVHTERTMSTICMEPESGHPQESSSLFQGHQVRPSTSRDKTTAKSSILNELPSMQDAKSSSFYLHV